MVPLGDLATVLTVLTCTMRPWMFNQVGVFGSYSRGEQTSSSDLDVLVSFLETPSLLRLVELEDFLPERLGVKVDVVMERVLKPGIAGRIRKDRVSV